MRIDKTFKRRVRIVSEPGKEPHGHFIKIRDAETGEAIEHVGKAVITLIAGEYNAVELTYYVSNEIGHIMVFDDGDIREETIRLNAPELDILAYEEEENNGR